MKKLSYTQAVGQAQALAQIGFSEDLIKQALANQGMSKEAWGGIARIGGGLLRMFGKGMAGKAGRFAAGGASKVMAPARAGMAGRLGHMGASAQQAVGNVGQRAGNALAASGRAFKANPLKALGGGAREAGKGMLFAGGKGVGGAVGKAGFGVGMYNMMTPGGTQPQMPRPYGQYGQQ